MPDEFDFKNYKTIEEFDKSLEGTKYLHGVYLKAVNHPIRREILNIINKAHRISKNKLLKTLLDNNIVKDEFVFNYNIDYLIKAFCIQSILDGNELYYEITLSGKVVEYLK
ncbi:MAG: hypothetical protein ACTSRI_15425 [Promethearchaeota archaeon]